MPEYLAPGVYVEETSFRAKSIEGVGTSTTAFVGPTRRGPIQGVPEMVTSLTDFEHIYCSLENLGLADVADAGAEQSQAAGGHVDDLTRKFAAVGQHVAAEQMDTDPLETPLLFRRRRNRLSVYQRCHGHPPAYRP